MQITVETLVKILVASELEKVITRAVLIESGIKEIVPTSMSIEVYKTHLPEGTKFKSNNSYGYIDCKVLTYNEYKVDYPFLVMLPDGATEWVRRQDTNRKLDEIVSVNEEKKVSEV